MLTILQLNSYIFKNKYAKIGKGFMLFVRLLMAINTWNAEETSWCNKEFISCKKVYYSTICDSSPHSKFCYQFLNENVPDYVRKENWSPDFCDLKLLDYAIWHIKKKILNKSVKRYEDIEGLSAAISYAWDKLTKKFINNSIEQLRMRLEKVVEGGSHIEHLIWRHWLMIPRTFL